jgi:hypothetical protein
MSFFYQIENSENINKIYTPPYPSGAGTIPYNWGWVNKYGPRPTTIPVRPSQYSYYANPNITHLLPHINSNTIDRNYAGAVNSIYEVEISGIGNLSGGCISTSGLNRKFLVYLPYYDNDNNTTGGIGYNTYWFGRTCDRAKIVNLCNIDTLRLGLELGDDRNRTQSSGILALNLLMYYANSSSSITNVSGAIEFRKTFGYTEIFNSGYQPIKPHMMDGEIQLIPTNNGIGFTATAYDEIINGGFPGTFPFTLDTTSGNYKVDLSNAGATIRPYKSNFYDIKNTDFNFYSGQWFPMFADPLNFGNANFVLISHNFYPLNNSIGMKSFWMSPSNYYSTTSNYSKIIPYNTMAFSGQYQFMPYLLSLSFNNVNNVPNSGRSNCISCDKFYKAAKNLYVRGGSSAAPPFGNGTVLGDYDTLNYIWTGYAYDEPNVPSENARTFDPIINYNYYNICNHGCNSIIRRNLPNGPFILDFNQGPCNNFIEMTYEESGVSISGMTSIANIYFGAIFSSGSSYTHSPITAYSSKRLSKTLCLNGTTNPCCGFGYVNTTPTTTTVAGISGIKNMFDSATWSSGWVLQNNTTKTPLLPSYLDINNYCDFSSGNVILTPENNMQTPCATVPCTICDGRYIPQSVNITDHTVTTSGVTTIQDDTFNFILTQKSNWKSNIEWNGGGYYGLKSGCTWSYNIGGGSGEKILEYIALSNGYNVFIWGDVTTVANIPAIGGIYISGLSTGGAADFRINCANDLTYDVTTSAKPDGVHTFTSRRTVNATLTDLYDILDYVTW